MKKQMKITIFGSKVPAKIQNDCMELHEEIEQLEQKLKEKQNELFIIQRNSHKHERLSPKHRDQTLANPMSLVATNLVEGLKGDLELIAMLSGTEVKSYKDNDHCRVMYYLQHDSANRVKHGLQIDLSANKKQITKCSMPLGFNLSAVLGDFDNIMDPTCLSSVRRALVAYYDRLKQFEDLKKLVKIEANLFKVIDGSHMEISFLAYNERERDEEQISVVLFLDYRVYDIRPKTFSISDNNISKDIAETLKQQCLVFKKKPLQKAFREAFINGIGPYQLVRQMGTRITDGEPRRPKPSRPNRHYNNDDTFHPEDCSDDEEEAH